MPVVTTYLKKLTSLLKEPISNEVLIEKLPYLGLDIEEITDEYLRIEYNPNRPDFATDQGLARGLNGILGFEVGPPKYPVSEGEIEIIVDESVKMVRPFIAGIIANNIELDDECIRQIITLQEDLHNGVGRKRRKVSIGIHNLDVIKPPIEYTTASRNFQFVPLNEERDFTIEEILKKLDVGITYGYILNEVNNYPILKDSKDNVLSFPPIINSSLTNVTSETKNLFVDITGTDLKSVENALSVLATTLYDIGSTLENVKIIYDKSNFKSSNMNPYEVEVDLKLTNELLGLDLSKSQVSECLSKSRIGFKSKNGKNIAIIPKYRFDIMHQVDLVEEIAIGYGLDRISSTLPESFRIGGLDENLSSLDTIRETLIGLGFIEVMNFSLVSNKILYNNISRQRSNTLEVENTKSGEHEVLRDMLLPSILQVFSKNNHEPYPQKIYEIAKVFVRDKNSPTGIREEYHVGVAISHSQASFTEAKSYLSSLALNAFGIELKTEASSSPIFYPGRTAEVKSGHMLVGEIGEVNPSVLDEFQTKMPIAAFELNLENLI